MPNSYLQALEQLYKQAAHADDAVFMKKYMLNQFEFFGIRSQARKELNRSFFKEHGLPEPTDAHEIIYELWQKDEREFQYFGIEMSEKLLKNWGKDALATIEFMTINKSWWDTVDWIASHHAGYYFKQYPDRKVEITERWMVSGNIWLQRSALLFQLKYKSTTDESLLYDYIRQLKNNKEFFIRKAIGWSLREYSKTAPESVLKFVNSTNLSGLSHREALKWLRRKQQDE